MNTKICSCCKNEKEITEFIKDKSRKDGYRIYCKKCKNIKDKIWGEKNKDKVYQYTKNWTDKNREKRREYLKNYDRKKRSENTVFKLKCYVRNRIRSFFKLNDITKGNKTFDIIGCTPLELKSHLENLFTPEMTWENYGKFGWHIDHIIPLESAKTEEEMFKLCHYTNLQPLWWLENLTKRYKNLITTKEA